jgi:ABC-2 type transport system permease protein
MSGAVLRQSLRQVARPTVIVALGAAAFFFLTLLSSASFLEDFSRGPEGVPSFFEEPPRAIEAFLGGSADFFSPQGWLVAGMLHPIVLSLLTSGAIMIAAGAVATELERGTIDLVLSRPISRTAFLLGKAVASLIVVTVVHAGGFLGVLIARAIVERVDEIPVPDLLLAFAGSWVLFAAFAMVALLISSRSSLRGRATGITIGVVVTAFFVNFMALLFDEIDGARFVSPFHYFRPADILKGEPFVLDLLVLAAVAVVAGALAVWRFGRRDLTR